MLETFTEIDLWDACIHSVLAESVDQTFVGLTEFLCHLPLMATPHLVLLLLQHISEVHSLAGLHFAVCSPDPFEHALVESLGTRKSETQSVPVGAVLDDDPFFVLLVEDNLQRWPGSLYATLDIEDVV